MSRAIGPNNLRALLVVVVAVAAVVAYQAVTHWTLSSGRLAAWGPLLATAPILLILAWIVACARRYALLAVLAVALCVLGAMAARRTSTSLTLLYLLPHAIAYGTLLWMFGRTLVAGRESLCTVLARRVHGDLPPEIEIYTRRVTLVWSGFFAGMLALSILLFAFAPLHVWSLFANLLNVPLIVALFVGEYLYRLARFPTFSHASFLAAVRLFRQYGLAAVSVGRGH